MNMDVTTLVVFDEKETKEKMVKKTVMEKEDVEVVVTVYNLSLSEEKRKAGLLGAYWISLT